jgi:hypothetical protein
LSQERLGSALSRSDGEVFIPSPHAAQFGVRAAPEQWGTHHLDDFSQELVLAAQTAFDFGHEIVR